MIQDLMRDTGLSLERLQSFCIVAQAGGVTKAANGNSVRQSLYSRQIKELEAFFGTELIRRKGRGIVLTPAGQRLCVIARESFAAIWDFKGECKQMPAEIVIGAGDSVIHWLLMPSLGRVRELLPNARLRFLNLSTNEIVSRLAEGLVDFGVVRKNAVRKGLQTAPLGTMSFSLFAHPESSQTLVTGEQILSRCDLATLEGEGTFRKQLADVTKSHRLRLNIQIECSSFPMVACALQKPGVAAILPSIAKTELGIRGLSEIRAPFLKTFDRELTLVWSPRLLRIRTVLSRAEKTFSEVFRIGKPTVAVL